MIWKLSIFRARSILQTTSQGQLLSDAAEHKGLVRKDQKNFVRNIRVPADATDDQIQNAIQRVFKRGQDRDVETGRETEGQSSVQGTKSDNQCPSSDLKIQDQSSILQSQSQRSEIQRQRSVVRDSDPISSIMSETIQEEDQSSSVQQSILSVFSNSTISLDDSLKQKINSLLRTETPYDFIIERIERGINEVLQNEVKYKMKGNMLVAHHKEQNEESQYWRMVLPDSSEIRNLVIAELHAIPFMAHPGISRTVNKVRSSFFWKGMAGDVRAFVEACPVCQLEKTDHTLSKGQLQSSKIPEVKWQEVSLDFITDLPRMQSGDTCILTVIDKATRMVHLIPCKETVDAAKTAELFWHHVGKLHGIPRCIYSDRGPQFNSRFWRALWDSFGTSLRFSSAYHPQTQGMVERMNSVVSQTLRCLIHSLENERN